MFMQTTPATSGLKLVYPRSGQVPAVTASSNTRNRLIHRLIHAVSQSATQKPARHLISDVAVGNRPVMETLVKRAI